MLSTPTMFREIRVWIPSIVGVAHKELVSTNHVEEKTTKPNVGRHDHTNKGVITHTCENYPNMGYTLQAKSFG